MSLELVLNPRRLAALLGVAVAFAAGAAEVTFHLAPLSAFSEGVPRAGDHLPEGTVFLYLQGEARPAEVVPIREPQEVGVGAWHGIAEAPGYVSADSGMLLEVESGAAPQTLVWPVVPACELALAESAGWRGVERLDVVSPGYGSTYPIVPGSRPSLNVPAGDRPIAYTVGTRGLVGIALVDGCAAGATVSLPPPAPPPADRQDLLVRLTLPEGVEREGLEVVFAARRSAPVAATAAAWSGRRGSFFFLGLPAERPGAVRVAHPRLRSREVDVEPAGGSARELPQIELVRRLDLAVDVDYRPRRPHRVAVLEALYCGARREPLRQSLDACPKAAELPLVPGLQRYTFLEVEDGLYIVSARIDEEVIHGLGAAAFFYVDPASEQPPETGAYPLVEEEIHGAITDGGRAVPGEVRLLPVVPGWPPLLAATGEDLLYRLTYFGRRPFGQFVLPGDEQREAAERTGLYFFYRLSACDDRGACRHFHADSILRGSGRLDLEIGGGGGLAVEVVDGRDGSPVGGATFRAPATQERLVFDHGDVHWEEAVQAAGHLVTTDAAGRVRLAALPAGRTPYEVRKEGFAPAADWAWIEDGGEAVLRVELLPESPREPGSALALADGTPLGAGALLAFDDEGRRLPCREKTDAEGRLPVLAGACRTATHFVFLHPFAALEPIPARRLLDVPEVELPPAPSPPLRLRVVDAAGEPLPNLPVELRFDALTLGENDLLAGLGASGGVLLFRRTDAAGELTLTGVDPRSLDAPEIAIAGAEEAIGLGGYRPGDVVTYVFEP